MNKYNILLRFLLMTFFFPSCNNNKEVESFYSLINQITNKHKNKNGYYLIIPIDGCGKCVEEAIIFSKKHIKNNNITYILSSLNGSKTIKYYYDKLDLESTNFIIDSKGIFYKNGYLYNGYVEIVYIHKNDITKKVIFPEKISNELSQLEKNIQ